jgi:FlaA1/EpsC-like NDP-sugar epimerase
MSQNYKNHRRFAPSFHFVSIPVSVAVLIGAVVNLMNATSTTIYSASLILVLTLLVISAFFHARIFALKAQNRAIRAEENLRHFILTGKPLDTHLSMGQIVALRFASDAEFPGLARKAIAESLSNSAIKQAIQNWRADYNRV